MLYVHDTVWEIDAEQFELSCKTGFVIYHSVNIELFYFSVLVFYLLINPFSSEELKNRICTFDVKLNTVS